MKQRHPIVEDLRVLAGDIACAGLIVFAVGAVLLFLAIAGSP